MHYTAAAHADNPKTSDYARRARKAMARNGITHFRRDPDKVTLMWSLCSARVYPGLGRLFHPRSHVGYYPVAAGACVNHGNNETTNFFISYTQADRAWAEWIDFVLRAAGHTTVVQVYDFAPTDNFVRSMHDALQKSRRTILLLSNAYLASRYCSDEWTAAFAANALAMIRIEAVEPPGLLKPLGYIDLVGIAEEAAEKALLDDLPGPAPRPTARPSFPGEAGIKPRFPGTYPAIWNVAARNPHFTGRDEVIERIRAALTAGGEAVVTQAIAGLGGVGKSETAIEYAHRHRDAYDLVWSCRAETATTLAADITALARALDLPEKDEAKQALVIEAVRRTLEQRRRLAVDFRQCRGPRNHRADPAEPRRRPRADHDAHPCLATNGGTDRTRRVAPRRSRRLPSGAPSGRSRCRPARRCPRRPAARPRPGRRLLRRNRPRLRPLSGAAARRPRRRTTAAADRL